MNELNLAIYTGAEKGHSVTMTAKFSTHDEAVRFHASVAELCRNTVPSDSIPWSLKRLMLTNAAQRP